jgi:hypothetical protein
VEVVTMLGHGDDEQPDLLLMVEGVAGNIHYEARSEVTIGGPVLGHHPRVFQELKVVDVEEDIALAGEDGL